MMLTLDRWREADEIFRLCYPVYIRRDNDRSLDRKIIEKIEEYRQKYGKVVRRIVTDPIELSSEQIRARLKEEQSISSLVPAAVEKYIRDKHLYV
jgi:nicotinate-nucleotide adenylyltransferase